MANLWEQREGESDRAFTAFGYYLRLGFGRSVDKAYLAFWDDKHKDSATKKRPQYPPPDWPAWSSEFDWVKRADAFDSYQTEERANELLRRRVEYQDQILKDLEMEWARWREVYKQTAMFITDGQANGIKTVRLATAQWKDLREWKNSLEKSTLRALGLPERITQDILTGVDGKPIQHKHEFDFIALLGDESMTFEKLMELKHGKKPDESA